MWLSGGRIEAFKPGTERKIRAQGGGTPSKSKSLGAPTEWQRNVASGACERGVVGVETSDAWVSRASAFLAGYWGSLEFFMTALQKCRGYLNIQGVDLGALFVFRRSTCRL